MVQPSSFSPFTALQPSSFSPLTALATIAKGASAAASHCAPCPRSRAPGLYNALAAPYNRRPQPSERESAPQPGGGARASPPHDAAATLDQLRSFQTNLHLPPATRRRPDKACFRPSRHSGLVARQGQDPAAERAPRSLWVECRDT